MASTTTVVELWPSSRSQTSVRSRPCTSTGSPLCTESRTLSASPRQQLTANHDVGPSTQSPFRLRIRGVEPTRKFTTLPAGVSRWTTSLPTQPWNVTKASFIVLTPLPYVEWMLRGCDACRWPATDTLPATDGPRLHGTAACGQLPPAPGWGRNRAGPTIPVRLDSAVLRGVVDAVGVRGRLPAYSTSPVAWLWCYLVAAGGLLAAFAAP